MGCSTYNPSFIAGGGSISGPGHQRSNPPSGRIPSSSGAGDLGPSSAVVASGPLEEGKRAHGDEGTGHGYEGNITGNLEQRSIQFCRRIPFRGGLRAFRADGGRMGGVRGEGTTEYVAAKEEHDRLD